MFNVLILAAGKLKNNFNQFNSLYNSPGLVSVNCRTALHFFLSYYQKQNVNNIYIAINDYDKEDVENELISFSNFKLILISNSSGVNETLLFSLNNIGTTKEDLLVSLVTTLPNILLENNQILISNKEERNKYYSTIHFENDIPVFVSKNKTSALIGYPFCGQIRGCYEDIYQCVREVKERNDFLEVVENLSKKKGYKFISANWIDIGHEINFYDATSKILSSRAFNSLKINSENGTITKYSSNITKFIDEISYIKLLPKKLQIYFPRLIGDVGVENNIANATMEYYSYSTLSEYYLYKRMDDYCWDRIFKKFEQILSAFTKYKFSIGKNAYINFYFTKVEERVSDLLKDDYFNNLINQNELIINSKVCLNYNHLLPKIEKKIDELYDENDFSIMHGDFCFNNILYDFKGDILKLLDPRGSFGSSCIGIYGDIKYDLAKLAHSSSFNYDYIVNDLFSIKQISDKEYEYFFQLRENFDYIKTLTEKIIIKLGYKVNNIYFLVGLLFISMASLHSDNKNRQKVMYLHGIYIINSILNQDEKNLY